jgi:translation elongation factor EF-1beta
MGDNWLGEKQNEKIEFDLNSVKFNIVLEQNDSEIEMINEAISFEIDKEIEENDECVPYDVKAAVKNI